MFLSQNDLLILNKFLTTPKPEKDLMNSFINLITTSSKAHLEELHSMYDKTYTPDLLTSLKKTLSGNILNASISLLTSSIEYDCLQLRNAMEGIGTDEDILIEIIGTRTNDILKDIIQQYPKVNILKMKPVVLLDNYYYYYQMEIKVIIVILMKKNVVIVLKNYLKLMIKCGEVMIVFLIKFLHLNLLLNQLLFVENIIN